MKLVENKELENSSIVANSLMNRERNLIGGNSYKKELRFEIVNYLQEKLLLNNKVSWLDICCGRGKALIETEKLLSEISENKKIKLVGIDLVNAFEKYSKTEILELKEASINTWETKEEFDLITCVHGLHYIGDKLGVIKKAVSWLAKDAMFIANLDLNNLKFENGKCAGRSIISSLRTLSISYDSKNHLLSCKGKKDFSLNYHYIGADALAGPNYTGQSAVDSYYRLI